MEKINDNNVEHTSFILNILEKFGSVEEDEIAAVESELSPEVKKIFQKYSQEKKMCIATVYSLSEAELKELFKFSFDPKMKMEYMVGFHNINSALHFLQEHTENPKFDFLRNPDAQKIP